MQHIKHCPDCLRNWLVSGNQRCPYCNCLLVAGPAPGTDPTEKSKTSREEISNLKTQLEQCREKLKKAEKSLEIEKFNNPFYKELVGDFEKALGPHPIYYNGCWIKRVEELRLQLTTSQQQVIVLKEVLEKVEKLDRDCGAIGCANIAREALSTIPTLDQFVRKEEVLKARIEELELLEQKMFEQKMFNVYPRHHRRFLEERLTELKKELTK